MSKRILAVDIFKQKKEKKEKNEEPPPHVKKNGT